MRALEQPCIDEHDGVQRTKSKSLSTMIVGQCDSAAQSDVVVATRRPSYRWLRLSVTAETPESPAGNCRQRYFPFLMTHAVPFSIRAATKNSPR